MSFLTRIIASARIILLLTVTELQACLAALSAASFPFIPTCAGTQENKI